MTRLSVSQRIWAAAALAALGLWPAASHMQWLNTGKFLNGVPAFFLGALALVAGWMAAVLVIGARQRGLKGLADRRARGALLAATALGVSIIGLFYAVELWRGKRAWARVTVAARAQKAGLDLASMVPAPVAAGDDLGRLALFAPLAQPLTVERDASGRLLETKLGALDPVIYWAGRSHSSLAGVQQAPWLEGRRADLRQWLKVCLKEEGARLPAIDPRAAAARIMELLEPVQAQLAELDGASARPFCRLPFDCTFPFFGRNPSDQVLTGFLRILRARAGAALELEQADAAARDVVLGLRLAGFLDQQPGLFSQSTRAYALADLLQPLWEGMARRAWSAAQLEGFQRELARLHPLAGYSEHTRLISVASADLVESIVPTTRPARQIWPGYHPKGKDAIRWVRRFFPTGWSLQDQAALCEDWLRHNGPWQPQPPERHGGGWEFQHSRTLASASSDPFFLVFIVPRYVAMRADAHDSLAFAESAARLALTACALERHRLARGAFPASLEALAPEFLDAVPLDLFDGRPLRYRLAPGAGPVLYSVGLNLADDQGRMLPRRRLGNTALDSELDLRGGDWVWQAPARAD